MLTITSVEISNILGVKYASLEPRPNSIYFLKGENGSGKTSFLKALDLGLTGKKSKRYKTYGQYLLKGSDLGVIDIDFILDNEKYNLRATVDSDEKYQVRVKNLTQNVEMTQSESKKFQDEKLAKYVSSTALTETVNFTKMSSGDLFWTFTQMFPFVDFSGTALNDIYADKENTQTNLSAKVSELNMLRNEKFLDVGEPKSVLSEDEISIISKRLEELKIELNSTLEIDTTELVNFQSKLNEIENKIKNSREAKIKVGNITEEIETLSKNIEEYNIRKYNADRYNSALSKRDESLTMIRRIGETIISNNSDINHFDQNMKLLEKGVCPCCGNDNVSGVVNNYNNEKQRLIEANEILANKKTEFADIHDEAEDLVKEELENKRQDEINEEKCKITSSRIIGLKTDLEKYEELSKVEASEDEANQYKTKIAEIQEKSANASKIRKDLVDKINLANETLTGQKAAEDFNTHLKEVIEKNNALIAENKSKQAEAEKIALDLESDLNDLKYMEKLFKKEIPNVLLTSLFKLLEDKINKIVKLVFPKITLRISFDEKSVSIEYSKDDGENWLPSIGLSGFESSIVDLAIRSVLAKINHASVFTLDEIDMMATEGNAIKFYNFLENEFEGQIFISTHQNQESIQKTISRDNLQLRFNDGFLDL